MARVLFHGNSLVADSSSLIYLAKASLIEPFVRTYTVAIPPSVYDECVYEGRPGSDMIEQLQADDWIHLSPVRKDPKFDLELSKGGERDVIALFYQTRADGILIDDRAGVKACRNLRIPFVNALLIPALLVQSRIISPRRAAEAIEAMIHIGRYSQHIILFARAALLENRRERAFSGGRQVACSARKDTRPPGRTSMTRGANEAPTVTVPE